MCRRLTGDSGMKVHADQLRLGTVPRQERLLVKVQLRLQQKLQDWRGHEEKLRPVTVSGSRT